MFSNRIRLPMQLHSAQFPEERNVFRKANGVVKTLSVIVRKQYELETDFLPEFWHQRLKIALAHDNIAWEGENYLGDVAQDGDYSIQWPEGPLHYPTAKAECKVQVTPFDATNANCQTCEEATQLDLSDDIAGLYGIVNEDTDYTIDTNDNDSICCFPAVFSLVSYNSDYLDSASIDSTTGIMSIHTGTGLISANGIILATYRVTCPNGNYDEADVIADINGSIEGCLAPLNLQVTGSDEDAISFTWDAPEAGTLSYYWEIYEGNLPVGSPVQTGTIPFETAVVTGLDPDTQYYFQVRQNCYGSNSNFVGVTANTLSPSALCGRYEIVNNAVNDSGFRTADYIDCTSNTQHQIVFFESRAFICALENSPGNPVAINAGPMVVNYVEPC